MAAHATRERVSKARQRMELLAQRAGIHKGTAAAKVTTSTVLGSLGDEWQRFDDIHWPGQSFADVEHVLVGPPGIFVIGTRTRSKRLDRGGSARHTGGDAQYAVLDGLAAAAHAVGSLLGLTHRRPIPVLCLIGAADIDTAVHSVLVCSTDNIVRVLQSMTPTLDAGQVRDFADRLGESLISGTGQFGNVPQQRER
jgi:hypothetical protein